MHPLLLAIVLQATGATTPPAIPEIVVQSSAPSGTVDAMKGLGEPKPKPGFTDRNVSPNPSLLEFVRPGEVTGIVIDLYDPQARPWGDANAWTPTTLKKDIEWMLSNPVEGFWPSIVWSELHSWSASATLTLKDNRQGRILFDGLHGCYQDPDGYRWFFRYQRKRP